MKAATMSALSAHPELRQAAEEILHPGETLSGFVEDALRRNVELRCSQQLFIERGLASREEAKYNGKYVPAGQVLKNLAACLEKTAGKTSVKKTPARAARSK